MQHIAIPALGKIYNAHGNPETQISENGPPFNSKAMENFTKHKKYWNENLIELKSFVH